MFIVKYTITGQLLFVNDFLMINDKIVLFVDNFLSVC